MRAIVVDKDYGSVTPQELDLSLIHISEPTRH